jgi:hypothetical protein
MPAAAMCVASSEIMECDFDDMPRRAKTDPDTERTLRRMLSLGPREPEATPLSDATTPAFSFVARQALLASLRRAHGLGQPLPSSLDALAGNHPLPPEVLAALSEVVAITGKGESEILEIFYALLAEDGSANGLDPTFLEALRGTVLGSRIHRGLRSILLARIFP